MAPPRTYTLSLFLCTTTNSQACFFLVHSNADVTSSYCVTPRSLTASYPCSRGTCYLHLQGSLFCPATGDSKFLQNVCNELPLYAGSYTQKTTILIVSAMRTCNDKKRSA